MGNKSARIGKPFEYEVLIYNINRKFRHTNHLPNANNK